MSAELQVEASQHDEVSVLTATGEIDLATAPDLQQRLLTAVTGNTTVLDLRQVAFIDSTGLRVLISAHDAAIEAGFRLGFVVADGPVTKLLRITGVDSQLHVFDSLDDALGDAADA